jgi:uncharacterized tellurite resistance protein B-like protein
MDNTNKTKQLFKILIGAAWIDGAIQPEEREYLREMAHKTKLTEDPEIKSLLSEIKPVKVTECYTWLENYLGEHPSQEDYQELIDAISALIYSDSNVETEEAKLLNRIQLLDPANDQSKSAFDKVLKQIRNIYRKLS